MSGAVSTQVQELRATFRGLPAAKQLTASDFRVLPFYDDLDFSTFEMLGRPRSRPWPRVLLNYTQKYDLLSAVLGAVRQATAGTGVEIVLASRMPSTIRMPAAMLGNDIFVVLDVQAEVQRLCSMGCSVIGIEEGLIRYAMEQGENEFVLTWYMAPADAWTRLQPLCLRLRELGFAVPSLVGGLGTEDS